ncbi:MAG TPA: hypothetical protein VLB04_05095 [Methanotrichaceae archaeon]|nr:hypothetical protein [Methanotrichaceae archaeon]
MSDHRVMRGFSVVNVRQNTTQKPKDFSGTSWFAHRKCISTKVQIDIQFIDRLELFLPMTLDYPARDFARDAKRICKNPKNRIDEQLSTKVNDNSGNNYSN